MPTGSPQLVRQWLLLKKLCASQSGKTITELSSELEVTAKTIRRDITVFRDAGFPIEESTGSSGRKSYHIPNGVPTTYTPKSSAVSLVCSAGMGGGNSPGWRTCCAAPMRWPVPIWMRKIHMTKKVKHEPRCQPVTTESYIARSRTAQIPCRT